HHLIEGPRQEGLADPAAGDPLALPPDGGDHLRPDPPGLGPGPEEGHPPPGLVAEGEVIPHDHAPHAEAFGQDLLQEPFGLEAGEGPVEPGDHHPRDPVAFEPADLLLQGGEESREGLGPEDRGRMGLEGEGEGLHPQSLGQGLGPGKKGLMPHVHPIKVAQGGHAAPGWAARLHLIEPDHHRPSPPPGWTSTRTGRHRRRPLAGTRSGRTRQTSWPRLSNTRAKPSCAGGSSLGRSGSTRGAPSKTTALPCCSRFIVVSSSTRKPGRWAIISAGLTRSRSSSPWATAASNSSSVDASSKT